jgi:hypothetical protein
MFKSNPKNIGVLYHGISLGASSPKAPVFAYE